MSTFLKQFRSYVKSVAGSTLSKPSSYAKHPGYSLDNLNRPTFPFQSLHAKNADTSTENFNQKKPPLWNRIYSGTHEYE